MRSHRQKLLPSSMGARAFGERLEREVLQFDARRHVLAGPGSNEIRMTGHPQGPSGLAFKEIAAIAAMIHEAVVAELDPVAKHLALHGHNGMQHVQDGPEPWAITGKSLKRLSLNCLVFFMRTLQFPAIPGEIESLLA